MRPLADAERIHRFMRAIGRAARGDTRVYLTGGASAVLLGWRPATIDVDLKFAPERDELFRVIPELKLELGLNVELAARGDFIPLPPGWEDRSPFIEQVGMTFFHHFDFYSQALAKVERGHSQDTDDVRSMLRAGLVDPQRALTYFGAIEPELYRFPAVDPRSFRAAAEAMFRGDRAP